MKKLMFTAEMFGEECDGMHSSCCFTPKDAAEIAQAIYDRYVEGLPKILMDELYWSYESDDHFKERAKKAARLDCIEEIKPEGVEKE